MGWDGQKIRSINWLIWTQSLQCSIYFQLHVSRSRIKHIKSLSLQNENQTWCFFWFSTANKRRLSEFDLLQHGEYFRVMRPLKKCILFCFFYHVISKLFGEKWWGLYYCWRIEKLFTKLEAVGCNKNLAWVSVALPRPQHEYQLSGGKYLKGKIPCTWHFWNIKKTSLYKLSKIIGLLRFF